MELEQTVCSALDAKPLASGTLFNNWNKHVLGWYFVAPSSSIAKGEVKGFRICDTEIVIYRGEDQKLRCLEAFCPHMGTHFGVGKVVGNQLRCFFHHWEFDQSGRCVHIPISNEIPTRAKVKAFAVAEKYESIWFYPQGQAETELCDFVELESDSLMIKFGKSYSRSCHHHVTMINGIDHQHLKTVHGIDVEMSVDISERKNQLDIKLSGTIGTRSTLERCARFLLGPIYTYSMRYDHANNGFLTLLKDASWRGGSRRLSSLHMIFTYRSICEGKTLVQPIFVAKKRGGLHGWLWSQFLLWITQRAFFALQGEDGLVYENMRFNAQNLLAVDRPVAEYIRYVNRLPVKP